MRRSGYIVSVVVPAKNEEDIIGDCLGAIRNSRCPSMEIEIVVVDGGSTDRTVEICRRHEVEVLEEKPPRSPGNARNMGVKYSQGDYIIFLDADQIVEKDFFVRVAETFEETESDAVTVNEWVKPYVPTIISNCFFAEKLAARNDSLLIPCAFKREVFNRLEGFDPHLGYAEVEDFSIRFYRAGFQNKLSDQAIIYHKDPTTLTEFKDECIWFGRTFPRILRKRPTKEIFRLFGWLLYASSIPSIILFWFLPNLRTLLLILLVLFFGRTIYVALKAFVRGAKLQYALLLIPFKWMRGTLTMMGLVSTLFHDETELGK